MTEIEKRAEELLGFRIEGNINLYPDIVYPSFVIGNIDKRPADKFHIKSWQTTLSLLTSLSLCEKTLGEYADEGNWINDVRVSRKNICDVWNDNANGYELAKKTLEEIKGK